MDLRQLRYFLAVAEERHFGRAAARVGICQPPLTARIREFETAAGIRLFVRGPGRPVELTEAGRALLPLARELVDGTERARAMLQSLAKGEEGTLDVAVSPGLLSEPFLEAVEAFRAVMPNIGVSIREVESGEQLAQVARGSIDVAVVEHVGDLDQASARELLVREVGVLCTSDSPLAKEDVITPVSLRGYALVVIPRSVAPSCHDELLIRCQELGFVPATVHESMDPASLLPALNEVSAENVIALMTRPGFGQQLRPGLAWRTLEGAPITLKTSAVVDRSRHSAAAASFAEALVQSAVRFGSNDRTLD
jgi:DNA-binding transcriptional LysR family regulator